MGSLDFGYDIDLLVFLNASSRNLMSSRQKISMKFGTAALLGLFIAATIKASQERVITHNALGAPVFSDAELLTSLADQQDYAAIEVMASENRCKLISKGCNGPTRQPQCPA
jgi:hypothetical protein